MKLNTLSVIAATALLAFNVGAQEGGRPPGPDGGRPGQGPGRMPHPIVEVLDVNKDGVIDADEITNAAAALRKLDKNGDGKLSLDEIRPARPAGGRGPGGPGGPGGPEGGPEGGNGRRGGEGRPQRPPADQ
jgi:hypothetical protein